MAKSNQEKLDDVHWILCTDSGRAYLAELIGGSAASKTLNTTFPRKVLGGETSLATEAAWAGSNTAQTIAAVAANAAAGGATVDEIQAAVTAALAEGVVKVDVTVAGTPKELEQ